MANLSMIERELLENLFSMKRGYVLDFNNRTFGEFFEQELGIDIFDEKYNYETGSKANRMRAFWRIESDETVAKCILKLIDYIQVKVALGHFDKKYYPPELIKRATEIANRLSKNRSAKERLIAHTTIETQYNNDGTILIKINENIFSHVKKFLESGHYFSAVEESFKIVREKLRQKTGFEKASKALGEDNWEKIFGHMPEDTREKDFFEGVKFLHMAIQNFRNEKVHTPANEMDKNLALHYIVLASLAYELISRGDESE